jgi:hypothetical protein
MGVSGQLYVPPACTLVSTDIHWRAGWTPELVRTWHRRYEWSLYFMPGVERASKNHAYWMPENAWFQPQVSLTVYGIKVSSFDVGPHKRSNFSSGCCFKETPILGWELDWKKPPSSPRRFQKQFSIKVSYIAVGFFLWHSYIWWPIRYFHI